MAGSGNPWVDMIDPTFAQQEELANQIQQEQQAADAFAKAKENPYGLKADRRQISNPDNLAWLQNLAAQQQPQPTPEMPEQTPTQGAGNPLAGMQAKYVKALLESQGLQKEGIKSLQERLKGLDAMKEDRGGLGKALATAADVWGGGGETFSKLYDEVNPNMSPAQKQASKQALEDTLRKARGDLSDSEIAQLKAQMGFEEDKMKLGAKNATSKLDKLGATEKNDVGSIASGIRAISQMDAAIKKGQNPSFINANTPIIGGMVSDNQYTAGERVLAEVVGRLQSGGAISSQEMSNFKALGPRVNDESAVKAAKLNDQRKFLENKLRGHGFVPQELDQLGFDVGISHGGGGLTSAEQQEYAILSKKYGGK